MSSFSQGLRPIRLSDGEELGDELGLIRQVFMMYDHRREGRLTVQEVTVLKFTTLGTGSMVKGTNFSKFQIFTNIKLH